MSKGLRDQADNLRKHFQEAETKIITISGGKGGVGKSIFSVNIATELSMRSNKVLLFDSDAGFANASILMGKNVKKSLSDYIDGKVRLSDCINKTDTGVNIVSTGFDFKDWKLFQNSFTSTMAQEFLSMARNHDYVLIDTGAGYSDKLTHFYLASDKIILITVPEPTAVVNAYTLIKALSFIGVNSELDIVLNMINNTSEVSSVEEVLSKTIKKFLKRNVNRYYRFMNESIVHESVKRQVPAVLLSNKSKFTKKLKLLVDDITEIEESSKKVGFTEKFKKLLGIQV